MSGTRSLDAKGLFVDRPTAITTYTGRVIDPVNPDPIDIDIEDIAHHLSNLCRFTGASDRFYSVAEHCVLVARLVPDSFKLEAILHDASEAYLSDIAKPIKESDCFAGYREIEDLLESAVQMKFRLPLREWADEVKQADHRMFQVEAKKLCPRGVGSYVGPIAYDIFETPQCWSPRVAEAYFLDDFSHYWNMREKQKEALL